MDVFDEEDVLLAQTEEAGPLKRIFSGIIDAIIIIALCLFVTLYSPIGLLTDFTSVYGIGLFVFASLIIYRVVTIFFLGGTLGMYLVRMKFLNGEMQVLSVKEKLLAALFILYAGVNYYNK